MKTKLEKDKNIWKIYRDGKEIILLGGEIHNSSASDSEYMKRIVWPSLEKLNGNFYLMPVYWEKIEEKEGEYNFDVIDEQIKEAEKRSIYLGLLWFGMWKGPDSLYIPKWMKKKLSDDDFQRDENGKIIRQLSPFAEWITERDKRAYKELLKHLKEYDKNETVIMIQVENEPGTWFHKRDYSDKAETVFRAPIPDEVAEKFGVSGTWEEAFSERAESMFMLWAVTNVIEKTASSGKEIYPLPTFTNCVPNMGFLYVAGGPWAENAEFWKKFAPSIDVLTPNVYDPDFDKIISPYEREDNPLMIPETGIGNDLISKLLYAVSEKNALMFCPFGVEDLFAGDMMEYKHHLIGRKPSEQAAENIKTGYGIIQELYPVILKAHEENRIRGVIMGPSEKAVSQKGGFGGMSEARGDFREITWEKYITRVNFGYDEDQENAPTPAVMLIEEDENSFLMVGVNMSLEFSSRNTQDTVFTDDLREYILRSGHLCEGRVLNGDERNAVAAGSEPVIMRISLSTHR